MTIQTNSFKQLGRAIEGIVQEQVKDFALQVWDEVVMSPVHPRDTGTLQYSWRMAPYIGGGQGGAGDTYKPDIAKEKDSYGEPARPNLDQYTKKWSNFILYNNQPYVDRVNDLGGKPYTNWIELGVASAVGKFK